MIVLFSKSIAFCAIFLFIVTILTILPTSQADEGWLPDRLGISYEFKIHIDAGKEECFFQEIHPHTTLYVAFQVSSISVLFVDHFLFYFKFKQNCILDLKKTKR